MVYLQVAFLKSGGAKVASLAVLCQELLLELLGEGAAATQLIRAKIFPLPKAISADCAARGILNLERFEWDALLANIACRAGRMIIAVSDLEFFGCDLAVLNDVINHGSRAFGRDRPESLENVSGNAPLAHLPALRTVSAGLGGRECRGRRNSRRGD